MLFTEIFSKYKSTLISNILFSNKWQCPNDGCIHQWDASTTYGNIPHQKNLFCTHQITLVYFCSYSFASNLVSYRLNNYMMNYKMYFIIMRWLIFRICWTLTKRKLCFQSHGGLRSGTNLYLGGFIHLQWIKQIELYIYLSNRFTDLQILFIWFIFSKRSYRNVNYKFLLNCTSFFVEVKRSKNYSLWLVKSC